jgi:hypothetical protein
MSESDANVQQTAARFDAPAKPPVALLVVFAVMIAAGIGGLFWGASQDPTRAWQAYLFNFLFFLGIGAGGTLFSAVLNIASGKWGRDLKRIADGLGLFLPISFILFLIMAPGLKHVLPWVEHPYAPEWWLRLGFLIWRDAVALGLLSALGLYMLYYSLRVDLGHANASGAQFNCVMHKFVSRNWQGDEVEIPRARRKLVIAAPIFAIGFAVVLTLIAMDLIMSLEKSWISTLIGAYYFAGCFFASLAALMLAAIWTRKRFSLHDRIGPKTLHDIAKLTMAFGVVTGDFFYCQLMLIWYGNIPAETSFLIARMVGTPWRTVGIIVLLFAFALPLLAMLKAQFKKQALPMVIFSLAVLSALWLERLFLIAPSITGSESIPLGPVEFLVTAGFVGLICLTFVMFIHRVPPIPTLDPVLDQSGEDS